MKRILLIAAAAIVAPLFLTSAVWAFGTKDVVQMHRDGIPDSLILQKIAYSGTVFHLGASDMRDLKQAGVPDEIVSAMLATEDQRDRHGTHYRPYYYPYPSYYPHPSYYPPYYPYYPRVVVGFGFYGYRGPYSHHYCGHRFHGYYGHGPYGGFVHGGHGHTRFR